MEYAFIIVGTIGLWAFLASRAQNVHLRSLLIFQTIILTYAMSYVMVKAAQTTDLLAVELFRSIMHIATLVFIFTWGAFWVIAKTEKGEMDDDQEL